MEAVRHFSVTRFPKRGSFVIYSYGKIGMAHFQKALEMIRIKKLSRRKINNFREKKGEEPSNIHINIE
jgi:hypothetical protein